MNNDMVVFVFIVKIYNVKTKLWERYNEDTEERCTLSKNERQLIQTDDPRKESLL